MSIISEIILVQLGGGANNEYKKKKSPEDLENS